MLVPPLPDGSPNPQVANLFAADGDGVLFVAAVSTTEHEGDFGDVVDRVDSELFQTADEIREAFPDATAEVGSSGLLVDSIIEISESDLQRGEAVALPIALIVMLVAFGGFLAAGMPLVGAIVSILGGLGALFGFTYLLDINTTVVNVVTAVGLGLSIDYGLLIVSRFREEYRGSAVDGARTREHRLEAIVRTADSAGRTVAFSGVTFAVAGVGLLFFEPEIVKAIGLGALSVTLISIASAITLLPALLSLTGEKLVRPGALTRIPGHRPGADPVRRHRARRGVLLEVHPAAAAPPRARHARGGHGAAHHGDPALLAAAREHGVDSIPPSSPQYTFITTLNEQFPDATESRVSLVTETEADAEELGGGGRRARPGRIGRNSHAGQRRLADARDGRRQERRGRRSRDPRRPARLSRPG